MNDKCLFVTGETVERKPVPPLVIGATGGSGTRVIARIAQRAGYDLGSNLNDANDALAFRAFHDRWINSFLESEGRGAGAGQSTRLVEQADNALRVAIARHLESPNIPESPWGWKAPRSIYVLPLIHARFPELKFIQVIRDGRDMAFSRNQNQLRKHGPKILSWRERWFDAEPVRSILLWARVNLHAAIFGEKKLGGNYLAIRFEDLCSAPAETVAGLLRFLQADLDPAAVAREEVEAPSSIGRWRDQPAKLTSKMTAAAESALRKFQYV